MAREHPDAKPNEGAARDDEEKRRCRSSAPGPILHCFLIHRILGVLLRVCRHRDALSFLKPISQPMSASCIAARPKRELAAICVTCSIVEARGMRTNRKMIRMSQASNQPYPAFWM